MRTSKNSGTSLKEPSAIEVEVEQLVIGPVRRSPRAHHTSKILKITNLYEANSTRNTQNIGSGCVRRYGEIPLFSTFGGV